LSFCGLKIKKQREIKKMIQIEYDRLNEIKQISLPDYLQSKGIQLKHNGNCSYTGLCPFHNDTSPSLSVSYKNNKWLWHCFGCNLKGTVIDFVMKMENLSFPEAYKKLALQRTEDRGQNIHNPSAVNPQDLLKRVVDFYHTTFKEDKRGLDYLTKRDITDQSIYLDFKLGFVNGSLRKTLPEGGPILETLKSLCILNQKGNEFFYNCVVFPILDDDGNIISLYGRNIQHKQHLYPPGPHKGIFNSKVLRTTKTVFITESIIDCLSLYQLGIKEAIPLYGTNGLTKDHIDLFAKYRITTAYLCLDNDAAGDTASKKLSQILAHLGIKTFKLTLPVDIKDPNDYLLSGARKEDFDKLVEKAQPVENSITTDLFNNDVNITQDDTQIIFDFKERSYRIRGLTVQRLDQLKVNIKLTNRDSYHLDTFDLYCAKQRANFVTSIKKVLSIEPSVINSDLSFIIEQLENIQAKMIEDTSKKSDNRIQMTEEERQQALEFLKSPLLFERILADFKFCGYVGEENNLLLGYLVSISRKLSTPLSILVISRSASGKSTLQDAILSVTPPEDYEKYTRLTDQALFYREENSLQHKLLAIEEEKGASGAGYSLRNLQSSGGLKSAATIKDPLTGRLTTGLFNVRGPTAMMLTTTYSQTDYETYNRFIILTIDESTQQTKLILQRQRDDQSIEGIVLKREQDKLKRLHHNAQRLIKPLEVANPYSQYLTFPESLLRARREQPKYLSIIKAVALLRQHQKEIKSANVDNDTLEYIESDLKDIELANRIANAILGHSLDEMSPPSRRLLPEIKMLVDTICKKDHIEQDKCIISRRDIREFTGWSDYQIRVHIKELEDLEYLIPVCGRQGKRFTYQLCWDGSGSDGSKFLLGLIDIDKLRGQK
jgi:DNA primase catalytic core